MAVSSISNRGYRAWITCDDSPLEVHAVETGPESACCWVASEAGKAFEVQMEMSDPSSSTTAACWVFVDGSKVGGRILGRDEQGRQRSTGAVVGARLDADTIKRMYFAPLTVTDDDTNITHGRGQLADMGVILVKVFRVRTLGQHPYSGVGSALPEMQAGAVVVHEKDKKLGGHHTMLGEEIQSRSNKHKVEKLDKQPYVTLEFRYRPRAILKAQGVIPRRQPQEEVEGPASKSSQSNKRRHQLNGSDSERSAKKHKSKPKGLVGDESRITVSPSRIVKEEPSQSSLAKTIDLTRDD